ncbi:hypothetical protein YC2023_077857 [Brassica napus]
MRLILIVLDGYLIDLLSSLLFTGLIDDGWLGYSMISLKLIYIVIIIVPMQESLLYGRHQESL